MINYRKHFVITETLTLRVKDWMRENPKLFSTYKIEPTSEQIGIVLKKMGYERKEYVDSVIYEK